MSDAEAAEPAKADEPLADAMSAMTRLAEAVLACLGPDEARAREPKARLAVLTVSSSPPTGEYGKEKVHYLSEMSIENKRQYCAALASQVTSCRLQVTSYKRQYCAALASQATSCKLQATSCKLHATSDTCGSTARRAARELVAQVTGCTSQVARYKLQATSCELRATSCKSYR